MAPILLSLSIIVMTLMDVAITRSLMIIIKMYKIVELVCGEINESVQFKR